MDNLEIYNYQLSIINIHDLYPFPLILSFRYEGSKTGRCAYCNHYPTKHKNLSNYKVASQIIQNQTDGSETQSSSPPNNNNLTSQEFAALHNNHEQRIQSKQRKQQNHPNTPNPFNNNNNKNKSQSMNYRIVGSTLVAIPKKSSPQQIPADAQQLATPAVLKLSQQTDNNSNNNSNGSVIEVVSVVVRTNYQATDFTREMSLKEGELLGVIDHSDEYWWKGFKKDDLEKRLAYFPRDCVQITDYTSLDSLMDYEGR